MDANTPRKTIIAAILKQIMADRALTIRTVEAMAKEKGLKLSRSAISAIANGDKETPSYEILSAIAKTLDITLDTLTGEDAGTPANAVRAITLDQIHPSPLNPRKTFDEKKLNELADDIEHKGLLQNIGLRPDPNNQGHFHIVWGERRYRAMAILAEAGRTWPGMDAIPYSLQEIDDDEHLVLAIIENLQREDVPVMEEAEALAALESKGWDTKTIGKTINKTTRYVQMRLKLVKGLCEEAKKALSKGEINVTAARILAAAPSDRQREAVPCIRDGNHNYQTEKGIREQVLRRGYPAVAMADFPIEDYTGKYLDDDGTQRFIDSDQFERLQTAHVKTREAELKETYAWVKVYNHSSPGYFSSYDYEESQDLSVAGAVLEVDYYLKITEHLGLIRKNQDNTTGTDTPKADEGPFTKGHLIHARQRKSKVLQDAVSGNARMAMIMTSLALMGGNQACHITTHNPGPDDRVLSEAVKQDLADCRTVMDLGLHPDEELRVSDEYRVFGALCEMDDEALEFFFSTLVARHVGSFNGYSPALGDSETALNIAREMGLAGREKEKGLTLEPEDLDKCSKEYLQSLIHKLELDTTSKPTVKAFKAVIIEDAPPETVLPSLMFGEKSKLKTIIEEGKW